MIQKIVNTPLFQTLYFNKSDVEKTLIVSCLFSCALSLARIVYTGQLMFIFLIWNLFLAYIPYAITNILEKKNKWINSISFYFIFLAWLLFIPNSFYIITDLFHLGVADSMPLWFDLALLLSFAWNGLLLGILSVRAMEKIVIVKFRMANEWMFILPVMWLNAFGIYIGRYLRFNSWDVITAPYALFKETFQLIIHPISNRLDWSMIFCFTILMTIIYITIKKCSKVIL